MDDPLLRSAHDQGLGLVQGGIGGTTIPPSDRLLHLADESSHLAAAVSIDRRASRDFADGLLGRSRIRHVVPRNIRPCINADQPKAGHAKEHSRKKAL
jgi:hypothetical protein